MTATKLVPIIGYVVVTGNYDDEGLDTYGPVVEGEKIARDLFDEALRMGFDDADVYMLVPPNSFPRVGDR